MLVEDVDHVVVVVGALLRQHFIKDDAKTVDIRALDRRHAARLLGREVVRRAKHNAVLRHLQICRIGLARHAKIHQPDGAIGPDHHIGRLDVAMDDAAAMDLTQRAGRLRQQRHRLARCQAGPDQV